MRTNFQHLLISQAGGVLTVTMNKSLESDLATSLELEGELQDLVVGSEDHHEGVAVFLQKRRPEYTGR